MRKLTHDEQVAAIAKINPNVEVLEEIKGNETKVPCRCKICHHEWEIRPNDLKHGKGCPVCGKIKNDNAKRLTHAEHVAAIKKINPNIEILEEIKDNKTKILCRCKVCLYEWNARPNDLKHGHGCPRCAGNIKLTHDEQVAAITKINPDVEVLGEIKSNHAKVLCRCKICQHEWEARPSGLKRGAGCPACAGCIKLTHAEQVEAINAVNPYIKVLEEIKGSNAKVLCFCFKCGHTWKARPINLKRGNGCPKCAGIARLTHDEQVEAIAKVNPDVRVLGKIKNDMAKVLCRCKVCRHEWEATPHRLKAGSGCPRCAKRGFLSHNIGKLYIMVDDPELPTMMKIGVSVRENERSKKVLKSAHKAGVSIPALHVAKTWEGPTELMTRIEQMMHKNYAEWNIKFPAKFDGCTEFFYYTPETANVFDVINDFYYTVVNQF